MPKKRAYYKNATLCIRLSRREILVSENEKYFEGTNTPTKALGAMFVGRAAELSDCGRHPYFRVAAGHRHLFNSPIPDDVAKKALVSWMRDVYAMQMGGLVRAGLALATSVKFASITSHVGDEELAAAADVVFNSAGIQQAVISYFGSRTKWELVADALVHDGKKRWADAADDVFVFPDGDDPDCSGEGPCLDHVRRAAGGDEDEEDADTPADSVAENPPDNADVLSLFPGVKKRVKPSDN